ncbi:hypothetical protein HW555_005264 [Spodoptera exigua]|uniref:Uncharacterized protein n=1 Tax=Spodoptera exigua TaxID=7107 RepID=A0A835GLH6_SPOEX|nr:hypothetical protein HW555_005264 [Spodoptera exigua]
MAVEATVWLRISLTLIALSFCVAVGNVIRTEKVIEEVNANLKDVANGDEIFKKIAAGESITKKPGIIMFTAPYKLCEGGCNGSDGGNIMLQFPLFIGKRGRDAYKRIFYRDSDKLYSTVKGWPFKVKTKRMKAAKATTTTTTTEAPTTTTLPTPQCPYFPPDVCLKKIKKLNFTTTHNFTAQFLSSTGKYDTQKSNLTTKELLLRDQNADMSYFDNLGKDYDFYDLGFPYLGDLEQRPTFIPTQPAPSGYLYYT